MKLRDLFQIGATAAVFLAAGTLWKSKMTATPGTRRLSKSQAAQLSNAAPRSLVFEGNFADTVVLFLDYRCAYCSVVYSEAVRRGLPFGVSVRHVVASRSSLSAQAAIAAECAKREGKFHEFSYALFARRDSIGLLSWSNFASSAGIEDRSRYSECVDNRLPRNAIDEDSKLAISLGVVSTPVAILRDKVFLGPVRILEELRGMATFRSEARE